VLKVFDRCTQRAAIRSVDDVIRRLPFRVQVIQTDNGAEFQSDFHWHAESQDIRHVYIQSGTRHLNGKVECSHRVDDEEFYQLLDRDGVTDDVHAGLRLRLFPFRLRRGHTQALAAARR